MITVGSLFAGIGGFCSAFQNYGATVLWSNEKDSHASKTYRANHPNVKLFEKGIEELSVIHDELEPVDILTAGFPCQPFSVAGKRGGFNDPRGQLFFEIIRLLKEFGSKRPKILIFENVPGLLSHEKGSTYAKMVNSIQGAGYWFMPPKSHAVLNTCKVTGIPQSRDRLFMVALSWDYFDDQCFKFPNDFDHEPLPLKNFLELSVRHSEDHYFDPKVGGENYFKNQLTTVIQKIYACLEDTTLEKIKMEMRLLLPLIWERVGITFRSIRITGVSGDSLQTNVSNYKDLNQINSYFLRMYRELKDISKLEML